MDTQYPRHSVAVTGIAVDNQGRALLIQRRDNGRWEPPGGILELAESIYDGLRREVREETGLDIDPIILTGVYKKVTSAVVNLVFRVKVLGGTLTVNDEATDFRWATESELYKIMPEVYAIKVMDALRISDAPIVRAHDGVSLLE